MTYRIQNYTCEIGNIRLIADDNHLFGIIYDSMWSKFAFEFTPIVESENAILATTKKQLDEYFAGKRTEFELPINLNGTEFQKRVWTALTKIPFGETRSYKEHAVFVDSPNASRAVGRTNGLNPISIVLPCHRVIGSNGLLTGYAGGLEAKKYLLELESKVKSAG